MFADLVKTKAMIPIHLRQGSKVNQCCMQIL